MVPSVPTAPCRPPQSRGGHGLLSHGPVCPGGFARLLCLKYSLQQDKREEGKFQERAWDFVKNSTKPPTGVCCKIETVRVLHHGPRGSGITKENSPSTDPVSS